MAATSAKVIDFNRFDSIPNLNSAVEEALRYQETAFVIIDGKLFTLVPAEVARDAIATKIAMRMAEQPTILHDIQTRLENEEAEDWE